MSQTVKERLDSGTKPDERTKVGVVLLQPQALELVRCGEQSEGQSLRTLCTNAQEGYTGLILAAYKGHLDIVKLLLQRGANILLQNKVMMPRMKTCLKYWTKSHKVNILLI